MTTKPKITFHVIDAHDSGTLTNRTVNLIKRLLRLSDKTVICMRNPDGKRLHMFTALLAGERVISHISPMYTNITFWKKDASGNKWFYLGNPRWRSSHYVLKDLVPLKWSQTSGYSLEEKTVLAAFKTATVGTVKELYEWCVKRPGGYPTAAEVLAHITCNN